MRVRFLLLVFFPCIFSIFAGAQDWKPYIDSAKNFYKQNIKEKAIEYFSQARERLPADSLVSITYISLNERIGMLYYEMGNAELAIKYYLNTLETRKKLFGPDNIDYANTCHNLAMLYYADGQLSQSQPLLAETRRIKGILFGKDHIEYGRACVDVAAILVEQDQSEKSIEYFEEAVTIFKNQVGSDSPEYVLLILDLAQACKRISSFNKSIKYFGELKSLYEKISGKNNEDYMGTCVNLANMYNEMAEYDKAEGLYKEARQIILDMKGKNHQYYAGICNNLATIYRRKDKLTEALLMYKEAKEIEASTLGTMHKMYGQTVLNMGNLFYKMGLLANAEEYFNEAITVLEKTERESDELLTANTNLAIIFRETGRYAESEQLFLTLKRNLDVKNKSQSTQYADLNLSLAGLYEFLGQYDKALPLFTKAVEINRTIYGTTHPAYAASLNNIAVFYYDTRQYSKALDYFMQSKTIREKFGKTDQDQYANLLVNMANLYSDINEHGKAGELYREGLSLIERTVGRDQTSFATALDEYAKVKIQVQELDSAVALVSEAKKIRAVTIGVNHLDYAESCINLGNIYMLLNKKVEAEREFSEAFKIKVHNVNAVFSFMNEKEKTNFINDTQGYADKIYSFFMLTGQQSGLPYKISVFNRSLVLTSTRSMRETMGRITHQGTKEKFAEWMDLKIKLAKLNTHKDHTSREQVSLISQQADELEKELTRLSVKIEQPKKPVEAGEIINKLKNDEAAIEFIRYRYYNGLRFTDSSCYAALVLKKNQSSPAFIYLFEKNQLDSAALLSIINSQQKINAIYSGKQGEALYNLVWKPLESYLKGIKTIYIASAGDLHSISIPAIHVPGNKCIADLYNIQHVSSTLVCGTGTVSTDFVPTIELFGGIKYDADSVSITNAARKSVPQDFASRSIPSLYTRNGDHGFVYLAGTDKEVSEINKMAINKRYSVKLKNGLDATEEYFKSLSGTNTPSILHFATHGFFYSPKVKDQKSTVVKPFVFKYSDDPLIRTGLALAGANNTWKGKPVSGIEDGILTALEVSNMNLRNTKLAVLSACETGLGDIHGSEGVYGLQRAFKIAGVENLIMSLWKVPDLETAEFMQAFYKNVFSGQMISNAFYSAQRQLKNKYRNEPYKWAAWILVR